MANKQININFNNAQLIDDVGAVLMTVPTIAYKAAPTWELHFVTVAENGTLNPVDLTSATAWHAAIDTDFDAETLPMVRTLDTDIDHSEAASGIIKVSLDAATETFYQKINRRERLQAYFEVRGLDGEDKVIFDYRFRVYALGAVDPEGGEPLPVESGGVTVNDVNAIVNGAIQGVTDGMQPLIDAEHKLDYSLVSGMPAVPTSTSQLTNDSGFTTTTYVDNAVSGKQNEVTSSNKLDYSLLSGTPTIPTVNDAILTIKYGTDVVGTFTANASINAEIVIPSSASSTDYSGQINYLSGIIDAQAATIATLSSMISGFSQELMTFTISGTTTERVFLTSGMI